MTAFTSLMKGCIFMANENKIEEVKRNSPEYLKRFAGSFDVNLSPTSTSYRRSGSFIRIGSGSFGSYHGSGSGVFAYFGYGIDLI